MTPSDYRSVLRQVAEASRPTEDQVSAVRCRLDRQLEPATELLRQLPEPSSLAVERVRRRLARPSRETGWRWALPMAASSLALAAAATLVLRLVPFGADTSAEPTALASTAWVSAAPSPVLAFDYRGSGLLSGEDRRWEISWEQGAIDIKVAKGQGAQVSVVTAEALVEVVGTQFRVERSVLGTAVQVTEGRVKVTCDQGSPQELTAGQATECLPTDAPALLGRAVALADQGSDPALRWETVRRGLERAEDPATEAELLRHQLELELGEGRAPAALRTALAHQALAGARPDIARVALRLALQQGDCATARGQAAHLLDLQPEEQAALQACDR